MGYQVGDIVDFQKEYEDYPTGPDICYRVQPMQDGGVHRAFAPMDSWMLTEGYEFQWTGDEEDPLAVSPIFRIVADEAGDYGCRGEVVPDDPEMYRRLAKDS